MSALTSGEAAQAQQDPLLISADSASVATAVVDVAVVSTRVVDHDSSPHTVATVEVLSARRGQLSGQVLVQVPGGKIGDLVMAVSHMPVLRSGDRLQLALVATPSELAANIEPSGQTVYSVVGGSQGAANLDLSDLVSQFDEWAPLAETASYGPNHFNLTGQRWPGFPADYLINPDNSGMNRQVATNTIKRSVAIWENLTTSDIDFTYKGITKAKPTKQFDSVNVIGWLNTPNPADRYVAQATVWTNGDPAKRNQIVGFDVRVNRDYRFANGAVAGKNDLQSVLVHEMGHVLGMGHVKAKSEIMFASIVVGTRKPLGAGDKAGAARMYPAKNPPKKCQGKVATHVVPAGGKPFRASPKADVIVGTTGPDEIHGLGGNDLICGLGGNDRIFGGFGKDRLFGNRGSDTMFGGPGDDVLRGGFGNDKLWAGDGADKVFGEGGKDQCGGGNGRDVHGGCENRKGFP